MDLEGRETLSEHISDETLAAFLDGTIALELYAPTVMHILRCEDHCYRRFCDASRILLSLREEE